MAMVMAMAMANVLNLFSVAQSFEKKQRLVELLSVKITPKDSCTPNAKVHIWNAMMAMTMEMGMEMAMGMGMVMEMEMGMVVEREMEMEIMIMVDCWAMSLHT